MLSRSALRARLQKLLRRTAAGQRFSDGQVDVLIDGYAVIRSGLAQRIQHGVGQSQGKVIGLLGSFS